MAVYLVPIEPGVNVIALEKAIILIGRQSDCDVSLSNSRKISRKHCCVVQVDDQFMVRDLGSTNGVFLNGQRIDRVAPIKLGDELVIGDIGFRVERSPRAAKDKAAKQNTAREEAARGEIRNSAVKTHNVSVGTNQPVALPDQSAELVIEQSIFPMQIDSLRLRDSGQLRARENLAASASDSL